MMTSNTRSTDLAHLGRLLFAQVGGEWTARMKRAAARWIDRVRDFAFRWLNLPTKTIHLRRRIKKHLRIGMTWCSEQLVTRCFFDETP